MQEISFILQYYYFTFYHFIWKHFIKRFRLTRDNITIFIPFYIFHIYIFSPKNQLKTLKGIGNLLEDKCIRLVYIHTMDQLI